MKNVDIIKFDGSLLDLIQSALVEWKSLGEIADYEQPTKYLVSSTNYSDDFETPVLTAGKTFILGYTDEQTGIRKASEQPIILFDDFTSASRWIDFDFKVKSSATKIITTKDENKVLQKYIFYFMQTMQNVEVYAIEHKRLWISNFSQTKIPIPPLEIQEKCVEILDKMTEMVQELTAELTLRNQQYAYYRDLLLSESELAKVGFEWKTLGEVGEVRMCKRILKNQTSENGDVPFFKIGTFGKEPDAYISSELFEEYKSKYSYPKVGEILISASGTIGRTVKFDGKNAYFQDSNIVWIENDESQVLNDYLWYFYQIAKWGAAEGGTIQRLYNDNLRKVKIPIPPLSEQSRIVTILDKFDKLTTDISEGLPKEIELRQKQYEYWREQLLSFRQS